MKHQVYLRSVIDSKFNCSFYSAALVCGDFCVNSNRVKLVLLSKAPLFIATVKVTTSATATAFLFMEKKKKKQPPKGLFHTYFFGCARSPQQPTPTS